MAKYLQHLCGVVEQGINFFSSFLWFLCYYQRKQHFRICTQAPCKRRCPTTTELEGSGCPLHILLPNAAILVQQALCSIPSLQGQGSSSHPRNSPSSFKCSFKPDGRLRNQISQVTENRRGKQIVPLTTSFHCNSKLYHV